MQVIHPKCAGLDVHKKSVVACFMATDEQGQLHKEVRTFNTVVADLLLLGDWLKSKSATHVVMESTASYWKPVYNLLEGQFELLVVNAQHIKAVPGRKSDVMDSEWLADLLRHGLVRASFIPSADQRQLRELTRYRTSLVEERGREANRLQKVLEDSNLKLASVVTDILGVSARAMLESLLAGETNPEVLAELARGRLREKKPFLVQALQGELKAHHRFMVAELLAHIDYLDEAIERMGQAVAQRLDPFEEAVKRLDTIPGVNRRVAEIILAEIGADMSQFGAAAHLASWAGLCPGNRASAGKRLSGKIRKGNAALRRALIEAAQAAAHTKNTFLSQLYRRLAWRRGKKIAIVAVAHRILVIIYQVLSKGEDYKELASEYQQRTQSDQAKFQSRLVRKLEKLGYQVSLTLQPTG
jgi:transposase